MDDMDEQSSVQLKSGINSQTDQPIDTQQVVSPLVLLQPRYQKLIYHNPLIKDKGGLSSQTFVHEVHSLGEESANTMPSLRARLNKQPKAQSFRVQLLDEFPANDPEPENQELELLEAIKSDEMCTGEEQKEILQNVSSNNEIVSDMFLLQCDSMSQLTLRPKMRGSNSSQSSDIDSNTELQIKQGVVLPNDSREFTDDQIQLEKTQYTQEMNKLIFIEQVFKEKKQSANQLLTSGILKLYQKVAAAMADSNGDGEVGEDEYIKQHTADFPVKFLTHGLLDDMSPKSFLGDSNLQDFQKSVQVKQNGFGTPRFPTAEEIEQEERRLLMTFAFKDRDEIATYRREMTYIVNQEAQFERSPQLEQSSAYKKLKYQLRRYSPSSKKTLVFCGIDGLFMFSSLAQIVKTCDRSIKIKKDGIKRNYKIFFRPHLYGFIKTLSQQFELVLYLTEEQYVASQWVHVLNSFTDSSLKVGKPDGVAQFEQMEKLNNQEKSCQQQHNQMPGLLRKKTITQKFFDIILTKEHCIQDRQVRVPCRNRDLLLEGRNIKDIVFICTDVRDALLVHQNSILVRPYYGNKYENTLTKLRIYLQKYIAEADDIRDVIKRDFLSHLKTPIDQNKQVQIVSKALETMMRKKGAAGL